MVVLSDDERKRSLDSSVRDAMFSAMMFSLTSSFFGAFAVALGADNFFVGLLASVPLLFWTIAQIPSAKVVESIGRRKKLTISSLLVSRLMFIPIILIPTALFSGDPLFLIIFVSISSFFAAFSNPAWASWMGDLVPSSVRGRYFGRRMRMHNIFLMTGLIAAALVFTAFPTATGFAGFQIIFATGLACGMISLIFLRRMSEPKFVPTEDLDIPEEHVSIRKNRRMKKFIAAFFIWHFGVMLSAPFYVVRLLKYLNADYTWVSIQALLMGISMAAFQTAWGRSTDKFGGRVILSLCAIGAAFYPLLWLFPTEPFHIIPIEILGGIAWSGVNVAYFNYLLEISPSQKRTFFLAMFFVVFGMAGTLGPLAGGMISEYFTETSFFSFTGLEVVFLFSWMIRLAGALLFIKMLEELPIRTKVKTSYVFGEMVRYGQKKAVSSIYLTGRKGVSAISKGRKIRGRIRLKKRNQSSSKTATSS